jgi:hypothetical protein
MDGWQHSMRCNSVVQLCFALLRCDYSLTVGYPDRPNLQSRYVMDRHARKRDHQHVDRRRAECAQQPRRFGELKAKVINVKRANAIGPVVARCFCRSSAVG